MGDAEPVQAASKALFFFFSVQLAPREAGISCPVTRTGQRADGRTLNPAEQARQQVALRSLWSLQIGEPLVILQLEAVSRTQRSFPIEKAYPQGVGLLYWS